MAAEWHFDNGATREIITGPSTVSEAREELERRGFARNLFITKVVPIPLYNLVCGLDRFDTQGQENPHGSFVKVDDVVRILVAEGYIPPLGG